MIKQQCTQESKLIDDIEFDENDAKAFEALLQGQESDVNQIPDMVPGSILKGRIVEFTKDHVVVDVNLKSEGLVPISDFSDPSELVLDGEIEVYLEATEDPEGQIVLSREKAERQRQWEYILEHCEEGSIVKGKVIRRVKGGLMVDIGMEAFLPGSQIDNKRIKNLDDFLDKTFEFKIIKINTERKNVVVSRRELIEAERMSKRATLLEQIEVGELREGVVKNITDFGVFLDLDGIDGLLHITDMTWKRIKHPSEMVQIGDKLKVIVLNVDRDKGRIALGLKQTTRNPWEEIEEKYPIGSRVKGKIVNLVPYGAFIEIEPGIEGLIHVSEMSWVKTINDPSEIVEKGEVVEAVVLAVQKEEGKISLGIKQTMKDPWENIEGRYEEGAEQEVEVKNLTNYGAFVGLEPGIEGLIHISDLSWVKRVSHPSEVLKKGDVVRAKILSIDIPNKKITLGIKQFFEDPWQSIHEKIPVGSVVTGEVTKTTAFGAFVQINDCDGVEGLVHFTELSSKPFARVEDVVSKGDQVSAKVLKIDPENQKIALSIKDYEIDQSGETERESETTESLAAEVEEES